MLTQKQAWLKIAENFRKNIPLHGICFEIFVLHRNQNIKWSDFTEMMSKLKPLLNGEVYLFPIRDVGYYSQGFDDKFDIARAEICEKFAAEI